MSNPNIKPRWKKGESGNPKGRPKGGRNIPDLLRRFGALDAPDRFISKMRYLFPALPEDLTVEEAIMSRVCVEAMDGQEWAVNFFADRTEGKVKQTNEFEFKDTLNKATSALADIINKFVPVEKRQEVKNLFERKMS